MQVASLVRRYGSAAWRHRWKALALSWVICLAGWAGVLSIPDSYQSSTRVYADADLVLSQLLRGIAVDSSPASQVELLQRTLLSRPNLERVVARTDLDMRVTSAEAREALLGRLEKDIKIAAQTKNLFTITYADREARIARDVVQALLTLFIELASSNDRQQMENARTFIAQQIASYETQLREAERRRAEFRVRYMDLLPSDALGGITRMEQARAQVQQLTGMLTDVKQRRDLLKQQLAATPQTLSAAEVAAGAGTAGLAGDPRLIAAENTLRELRLVYTEQHPAVVAARNALAEIRKEPAGSRSAGAAGAPAAGSPAEAPVRPGAARIPNPVYEQIRLRLIDADAAVGSLERQLREEQTQTEKLEALARGAPQLQAEFTNLDRDYGILRRNYEDLLARRESVQIAGAARTGAERVRLEVVDPPIIPTAPVSPNRLLLSSLVLVVGLGAGAALAFLLTQLDRGFYTLSDLRRLGLPVLGSISSADPPPRVALTAVTFGSGLALLLLAFSAVLVGGPSVVVRLTHFVGKLVA